MLSLDRTESDLKRKISQLSTTSTATKASQASDVLDLHLEQIKNTDAKLELALNEIKAAFDAGAQLDGALRDSYKMHQAKRAQLAYEDVTIRRARARILDNLLDSVGTNAAHIDWVDAFANIITQVFKGKIEATKSEARNSKDQQKWADELKRLYGAFDPENKEDLWCPVLQEYGIPSTRNAAHIVPHRLAYKQIGHLFGENNGYDVVWKPENGMILSKEVEKAMDHCWIAMMPKQTKAGKPTEWLVVLIDESKRNVRIGSGNRRWGDLDQTTVKFLTAFRPGLRYMYYQFVVSMLVAVRFGVEGWAEKRLDLMKGEIWATPGNYLNRSILARLGASLGHRTIPQSIMAAGTFQGPDAVQEDADMMAKEMMVDQLEPKILSEEEGAEDDEEMV